METREPFDETDGSDETLMFWDFNPDAPSEGTLRDDELFAMLSAADEYSIVFVADSCHSGGVSRGFSAPSKDGLSRTGPSYGSYSDSAPNIDLLEALEVKAENWDSLNHVTYLTATESESRVVHEIRFGENPHGALSVGFAQGITGSADVNEDKIVSSSELENYLSYKVSTLSENRQTPGFLPSSGNDNPLVDLSDINEESLISNDGNCALNYSVDGGKAPIKIPNTCQLADATLHFEVNSESTVVFQTGDEITRFPSSIARGDATVPNAAAWQSVFEKFILLSGIDSLYATTSSPVAIKLNCAATDGHCNNRHAIGRELQFTFDKPEKSAGEYFVLFNLAGSGELQFLYPLRECNDPAKASSLPYSLPLDVSQPVGRDDLVAGFCRENTVEVGTLLQVRDGGTAPSPNAFAEAAAPYSCQWGRHAMFSKVD